MTKRVPQKHPRRMATKKSRGVINSIRPKEKTENPLRFQKRSKKNQSEIHSSEMDDFDFDTILDEELDRLNLDDDNISESDNFFPASKDCTCCQGFSKRCQCVEASSSEQASCTKCEKVTRSLDDDTSEPDQLATPNSFARAVEASATAVELDAAPTLSRVPSVTSSQDVFHFSVKIFPPPPSVLSREMFKMVYLSLIHRYSFILHTDVSTRCKIHSRNW